MSSFSKRQPVRFSAIALAIVQLAVAAAHAESESVAQVGQLSPSGYWGAINTPTADVIPEGEGVLSVTNSNPERARAQRAGSFGSLGTGLGLLPGLEGAARLSYEGDLRCSMYDKVNCTAKQRDLSVAAKYQIPLRLPLHTRLALGATDFGGAATHYRQMYGVATSTLGTLDVSLGYSRALTASALMGGAFGSAAWRLTDQLTALLENDSQQWRGGLQFNQRLSRSTRLQLAASRKLSTSTSGQQAWQMTAALQVVLGGRPESPQAAAAQANAVLATLKTAPTEALTAQGLALAIKHAGFAHVQVRHRPGAGAQAALWQVQAESRRWHQNQLDAVGAVLATWLQTQQGSTGADDILLTLTYQRQPVLHAFTSAGCLRGWLTEGLHGCQAGPTGSGLLSNGVFLGADTQLPPELANRLQAPVGDVAQAGSDAAWMPQIELGPNLRTRVGTEFGLVDYSLAGEISAEVALAPGLFWQGSFTFPVSHSARFDDDDIFGNDRHPKAGFDQAMLSYWRPLPHRAAVQASAGFLDRRYLGGQLDARWNNADGRLRASALAGVYRQESTHAQHTPVLGALRYSLMPGQWQMEATAGQFLSGDRGVQLASLHWWGDTQMKLYYSNSQGKAASAYSARRQMLGFTISFPLGPSTAQSVGSSWVRGADRWGWGLKTKVGEKDNILTSGYAEVPKLRHGLSSDVSDFDRNGLADLAARSGRVRDVLVDQLTGAH